jgi:hypothetical protein
MLLFLSTSVNDLARLEHAKEVFNVIRQLTGVESVTEFLARFQQAEEKNYSLFKRVDELALESELLRSQICSVRSWWPSTNWLDRVLDDGLMGTRLSDDVATDSRGDRSRAREARSGKQMAQGRAWERFGQD